MIIDAHAHISDTSYGNLELYLEQMQVAGIQRGIVVPGGMLDVRRMTDYIVGRAEPESLVPNNAYVSQACRVYTPKLTGFICIDPHQPDALEALDSGFRLGFRGMKLSPMSHKFSFASRAVADLAARCGELGMPVYTHVVYSPGASTSRFAALARQFPQTSFILGHMGFGPADQEGLEAARDLDNFYLETSTGSFLHIEQAAAKAGPGKVIYGSEFPLSHPKAELEKILLLGLSDDAKDKILGNNIRELLKLS